MNDSAGTLSDIARAIEQLATIRVRQQHATRHAVGLAGLQEFDIEAQVVREQIMAMAQALPAASMQLEDEALPCAAA